MLIMFETTKGDIVYLDVDHIVCIIGRSIITDANAWSLEVTENDRDRVMAAFKERHKNDVR